jgi:hypothetical protein
MGQCRWALAPKRPAIFCSRVNIIYAVISHVPACNEFRAIVQFRCVILRPAPQPSTGGKGKRYNG